MAERCVKIIAGPTASGKTAYGIELAKQYSQGAVILNADSMQIYKGLPILTAQPDAEERAAVPHKLYGIMPPEQSCSAAKWCDLVLPEIHAAFEAGVQPILVGGTGFYMKALSHGLSPIPDIPETDHLKALDESENDLPSLYKELQEKDPVIAERLKPTDKQRICRAIEVVRVTGQPLSVWQDVPNILPDDSLSIEMIVLRPDREWLRDRIDKRVPIMLEKGALDEVRDLMETIEAGHVPEHAGIVKAHGFRAFRHYLNGEWSFEKALDYTQTETRQYAKRQDTWFKNQIKTGGLIQKVDYIPLPSR